MRPLTVALLVMALSACQDVPNPSVSSEVSADPAVHTYREVGGRSLRAHVFSPIEESSPKAGSAVLLFHGGGWSVGSPEWTFDAARRFASWGMVAISGIAHLVDDPTEKSARWKDEWGAFYTDRETDYLLIQVTPDRMEVIDYSRGIEGNPKTWELPSVDFRGG